ncbi:hypothetical protein I4U23_005770 [Adineta vaga]|nr:hypothetical protein I4U23_005770 [Adineta vaga]
MALHILLMVMENIHISYAIPSQPSISFNTNIPFQFESQIRTTPIGIGTNNATAIKAFAAKIGSQNNMSITVSRRNQLLIHLNGNELTFDTDSQTIFNTITLRFEDFSISKNLSNNQLILSYSIGVNIQITPIYITTISTLVLNINVAISAEFKGNWTLGLIGGYDGNRSNDLRNSSGTIIGTIDTLSAQQIHELFGMTWAINPNRSLFYYDSNDNASFYSLQNRNYRPTYDVSTNGILDTNARETCGINFNSTNSTLWSPNQHTCYYDILVTGDTAFGLNSRQAAEEQIQQRESIRNPPKFNSNLNLTQTVRTGEQVHISFQATSEFSSNIIYKSLRSPNDSSLNELTGEFKWNVPKKIDNRTTTTSVRVSAQDSIYNLTSTYEIVFDIKQNCASSFICSFILLFISLISQMILQ